MRSLLKRIAVNGSVTAALLGLIGFAYAELAGIWMATQPVERAADAPAVAPHVPPVVATLRYRVPLAMAGCGLAFIVLCEGALYLLRGNPPDTRPGKPATPPEPDAAEVMLSQMLDQLEAAERKPVREPAPQHSC